MGRDDRLLLREVHGELNRWGKWIEARLDYEGYPRQSAYAECLESHVPRVTKRVTASGAPTHSINGGHRVLMLDMPVEVWATHHRVIGLTEHLRTAVEAWYIVRVKEDGTEWRIREKAERMGLDAYTLRLRVEAAKKRIAGLC